MYHVYKKHTFELVKSYKHEGHAKRAVERLGSDKYRTTGKCEDVTFDPIVERELVELCHLLEFDI